MLTDARLGEAGKNILTGQMDIHKSMAKQNRIKSSSWFPWLCIAVVATIVWVLFRRRKVSVALSKASDGEPIKSFVPISFINAEDAKDAAAEKQELELETWKAVF